MLTWAISNLPASLAATQSLDLSMRDYDEKITKCRKKCVTAFGSCKRALNGDEKSNGRAEAEHSGTNGRVNIQGIGYKTSSAYVNYECH